MCGIIGEFSTSKNLTDKETFMRLNDLSYQRGPDMEGYWSNNANCQLGFRRLSIIDLSIEGNQPVISNDGNYVMTFNGEIYNYKELRNGLQLQGIEFKGFSDSEVLINAFQVYGIAKTLEKIDGMFAIGLFDQKRNQLHLIRDFAGIKPLFYGFQNGKLVFGSRYDQVTKHPEFNSNSVNEEVLHTYLLGHYLPSPYALLNNTHQLEPGEIITFFSDGKKSNKFYWRLSAPNEMIEDSAEAKKQIIESLDEAVKSELVADVPVGTFLSGGVDSPLITFFANKNAPNIHSYTIGSDSVTLDETDKAKEFASLIGCQHFFQKMESDDAAQILEQCMNNLQEPFADFSLIPTFLVSKLAKEYGSTVVLAGDGADELFYGYKRYRSILKNIKFEFIPEPLRYFAYGLDRLLFKNKHINSNFIKKSYAEAQRSMHSGLNAIDLKRLFGISNLSKLPLQAYAFENPKNEADILIAMQQAEFYDMMQKTLVKVDRMSMAHSIEVRVPYLKKSFIETAVKIHPNLSYRDGETKLILKEVLKTVLPDSKIDAVKKGFSIPLEKWLRERLKEPFEDTLFSSNFVESFGLSKPFLEKIWKEHQTKIKDRKHVFFTLYSLAKWHENIKK